MRLRIISIWAVLILAGLLPQLAKAQIAASNPLEWAALAEGNELINGQIDKQIKGQTQTALMQKQYRSGVQSHTRVGETVQQLPQDGERLCLVAESLHAPL